MIKSLAKRFGNGADPSTPHVDISNIKNMNETSIKNLEQFLQNWKMPSISVKELYHLKIYNLLKSYEIKTIESTHLVTNKNQTFQMLSPDAISRYLLQGYIYLHIGLVQVSSKPLTTKGLDTSLLICLRDARHLISIFFIRND